MHSCQSGSVWFTLALDFVGHAARGHSERSRGIPWCQLDGGTTGFFDSAVLRSE